MHFSSTSSSVGQTMRVLLSAFALGAISCSPAKAPAPAPTPSAQRERPENPLALGQHTAVIDGSSIAYHVFGKGPVVIAHPGGPGGGWGYLRMPEVEKFATVVYIEPIGTGASGRLPNPAEYSRERDTSTLEGLRAHLGIEKIVLLGHSYGGFVALEYALSYPNHLRGLVLYDTAPTNGPDFQKDVQANKKWFENEPWYADATSALSELGNAESDEELTTMFRRAVPLYVAHWTERHKEFESSAPPLLLYLERSQRRKAHAPPAEKPRNVFDVRPRLPDIMAPTLILVGQKDFICSEKMASVMHQGIPGSRLVVFQGIGHLGHSETPAEHAGAIRAFLEQLGS